MKILYFSPIYYDDMKQRPQQIAECLAKGHEVCYIEPTVSFMRWLLKGGRLYTGVRKKARNNLKVIRLSGCLTLHKSIDILDICGINSWSELLQIRRLIDWCDLAWVGYSGWYPLVRHIGKPILLDKMDEEDLLVSSWLLKITLRRNMKKLAGMACAITVSSLQFYEEMGRQGKNAYLVPNAVSKSFARRVAGKIAFGRLGQVRTFGYVGTVGEWFDEAVVRKILELDENYEVVLVGKNYMPKILDARVHYLGVKKNCELPGIIQGFDVCLYNFKPGVLLDTVNPVKMYEYLSLNKPVLAVRSRETWEWKDYLMLYGDVEEIGRVISGEIKRPFSNKGEWKRFVDSNSWEARAGSINQILKKEFGEKVR